MNRGARQAIGVATPAPDRWQGLATAIWARLLVTRLALPVGVLLDPTATEESWWVLWWALLVVGALSALFALGVQLRRGLMVQTYVQMGVDLALVTAIAALTGGRESQFVPFFALVVISGGLLGRLPGGLFAGVLACVTFLSLPWIERMIGAAPAVTTVSAVPAPGLLVAFLAMMGVLAGVLGERVRRTREDLERTARELDRVRVDNDVILRHLTTGVLTVDGEGAIAYLNPAAEQVLALRPSELRGRRIHEALPERLLPLRDLVLETLEKRTPRARAELMMRTVAGRKLPLGISTNLLMHEGDTTGVVAVFQDLTEVREMERRARRNQTLAEVGALSAGIAHELRNGLSPITGSVECLQRELKLEGENAVLMELIQRECSRLNRFVTDLLNYSRERELAPEELDLEELLAELRDQIARDPRAAAGCQVRFERRGTRVTLRVDRELVRQVWLNLASNALEAMGGAGTLTLSWEEGEGDLIVVVFSDTGVGIAPDVLAQVGQPFFTTKERGTGLGLAIAQRIVERHGGSLAIASESGRGTTVRVALPGTVAAMAHAA